MTDKRKKLSETARTLLTAAAMRADHLIQPPQLPIAAARQIARSLLSLGLAEEVPTSDEAADLGWPVGDGGKSHALRATAVGLARIGEGADTAAASSAHEVVAEPGAPLTQTASNAGNPATVLAPTTEPATTSRPAQDAQAVSGGPNGRETAA
ncbi:MAG TPA: hypothetical protein VGC82_18545 [Rhodopila sp.]|jgi:hypothetical protein